MRVVEVLGSGCQRCQYLERLVREVAEGDGIQVELRHVTDAGEIASRGVLSTPGLVIDGALVSVGRVPTREQVSGWLAS